MPSLFAAALLLAAQVAQIPKGSVSTRDSGEPPAALAEESQVRDLCNALGRRAAALDEPEDPAAAAAAQKERDVRAEKAAARTYRVDVPSKGFAFGRYRASQRELELDGDHPLRAIENRLTLDLDGIDDVGFLATPEQVATWTREKKAGTLHLTVIFRPANACAGNAQARAWRLAGTPLSWELIGEKGVVAAADDEGIPVASLARAGDAAAAPARPRTVRIERVNLDDGGEPGSARLEGAQDALDRCAASAQRAGALVIVFAVLNGHVRDPQVIVDGARDEPTSRCVASALAGATLAGSSGTSARGTATVALQ
jgi:hypothetical protein